MVFNDYSPNDEKCDLPYNIDCTKRPKLRKYFVICDNKIYFQQMLNNYQGYYREKIRKKQKKFNKEMKINDLN